MTIKGKLKSAMTRRPVASGCAIASIVTVALAIPLAHCHDKPGDVAATGAKNGPQVDGFLPDISKGQVCRFGDAKQLDVASWAKESPSPVGTPSSELASPANLESATLCGHSDTVLTYPHLTVTYEIGWSKDDQTAKWQAMVKDWGTGVEETVDGYPAYVAGVTEAAPRGELLFVVNGTLVRIIGDGTLSGDDLASVGNSIKLTEPSLSKG